MKLKYIYTFIAMAASVLASCDDNDYAELDKGSTELALTANKSEVILSEKDHAVEAIGLAWTTGTNHGTGNRITYTLELAEAGSEFSNPYSVLENQQQIYGWNPTVEELNDIVREQFNAVSGQTISLDARITASVMGEEEVQTASTCFSVLIMACSLGQAISHMAVLSSSPHWGNSCHHTIIRAMENLFTEHRMTSPIFNSQSTRPIAIR